MNETIFQCSLVLLGFGVLLGTPVIGASDYIVKQITLAPIENYPARAKIGAVTIAVDPYTSDERSHTAFDVKDLNSRGYFPLHVIIQNLSPSFLAIKTREIVLLSPGGQDYYTFPATLVVQELFKPSVLNKLPKIGPKDRAVSTKVGSPLVDFTEKELTNRTIDPSSVSHGFLFFYNPEPKKNIFAGGKLRIPQILDESSRKPIGPFEIALDPALSAYLPKK